MSSVSDGSPYCPSANRYAPFWHRDPEACLFTLHAGLSNLSVLTDTERQNYAKKRHYFWFGEVGMAAMMAGVFAVPLGIFLAGRAEITLAFIGAAVLFLPLFVFLPKLIQRAMKTDVDVVIETFGKNEHVRKIFWTVFVAMAGLVLARVVDPGVAREVVGIITGMG